MCGIIGGVAGRDIVPILIEGLKKLEYRGYDSAGVAVVATSGQLNRLRCLGRVENLADHVQENRLSGCIGIAHTRWATHGVLSEVNAHPHDSHDSIMVVHNGIIENHDELRIELIASGYVFYTETDTEVIAHLIHFYREKKYTLLKSVQLTVARLKGIYSMAVLDKTLPDCLLAYRAGSPLAIGVGTQEYFITSDPLALLSITNQFQFLEEGDIAVVFQNSIEIYDVIGQPTQRSVVYSDLESNSSSKGSFKHFMLKEIYEQPQAILKALQHRLVIDQLNMKQIDQEIPFDLSCVENIHIVACGTSYHAALVSKYWFESIGLSCQVDMASEYRYRALCVPRHCLFLSLSQSGETADTLAALRLAKQYPYINWMTICNVATSSLMRESALSLLMLAGLEIGVASTKAFTSQLVVLLLLVMIIGRKKEMMSIETERELVKAFQTLPNIIHQVLQLRHEIKAIADCFFKKKNAIFLGRSTLYPIAMEGSLKLKEISYIHAEAYAAGELKHGPLALVDKSMPVIFLVRNDELLVKMKSNIEEVKSREGQLYLITDKCLELYNNRQVRQILIPPVHAMIAPIIYSIPLQLLAYEVAVLKKTNIDQPRNLAKSVTVE